MASDFGDTLRTLLIQKSMSQAELARKAGMGRDRITYYLSGGRPRPEKLKQLADALGVPQEVLSQQAHSLADTSQSTPPGYYGVEPSGQAGLMSLKANVDLPPQEAFRIAGLIAEALSGAQQTPSSSSQPPPAR